MVYDLASVPSGSFALIGTDNDVSSGANASMSWAGLSTLKEYEWYATVSDGTETVTGSTWSFTTSATINHAPVITEGTSANVTMSVNGSPTPFALTLHATDSDADTITWSISSAASHGTATASGTGASKVIGYTPTTGYEGSDSFVVRVSDGTATDTITVNVTIGGVNYAPDITETWGYPVSMSVNGTPTPFALTLHATDANADTLTWSIITPALHGTATASGTGTSKAIGYTPNTDYAGTDSFVVQVSDGLLTDSILINVTIGGQAPDITEDWNYPVTMSEDGAPTAFDLTLHATDADSTTLTWSISSAALHGTATASGTGLSKVIGYTPAANYSGADTFIVQVSDGLLSDTIKINVTIEAVNDLPVITESDPQAVSMSVNGTPTPFALTLHATDADSATLTWSILTAAAHGTATASGTGTTKVIGYTPSTDYAGADSFVVQVSDGTATDTITVNVTITGVNVAPVITESDPQAVGMSEDGAPTPFALTLHATDANPGSTLTWSILTAASHGTAAASGTGASKAIGYTPAANYAGADTFVVQVSDGSLTDTITVNVTIAAQNDAPAITESDPQAVGMSEDSAPTPFALTLNATDIDSGTLTWSILTAASHGTATASGTGASKAIGYTPAANYNGADSFVVQVSDGSLTDTITVNVTIAAGK